LQLVALDFARHGETEPLAAMLDAGLQVNLSDPKGDMRVAAAQPPMRTPETSEMRRTRCEVEAIRAKLPATPYSAPDAKQGGPFVELRAAMFARREAIKKAKAGKTE
jgi:hypothetical protein